MANYFSLRAEPFEAGFLHLSRVVSVDRWREIVSLAGWKNEKAAFSHDVAHPTGAGLELGDESREIVAQACERACGANRWNANSTRSPWNMFTDLGNVKEFAAVLGQDDATAAYCCWLRLCATITVAPGTCVRHGEKHATRRAPWWAWGDSRDHLSGMVAPVDLRVLAADLRETRMLEAIGALAASDISLAGYVEDIERLAPFLDLAARDGRWVIAHDSTS